MPIVSLHQSDPFSDGRQSDRAMVIRCGLENYFGTFGNTTLPELTLASGRRADLIVLCPKGRFTIVEIKSSVEDFRSDTKWPEYREFCDEFYFATLADVPSEIFPPEAGLLICDRWGSECLREAEPHPLNAARRKAMLLRFAHSAAQRLSRSAAEAGGYQGRPPRED